nr:Nitrate reductase [NADH] [Ipomoea batatas]
MVKKSIGFNWGAAAISTSVWRGVPLAALLKRCGIFSRKNGGLNVCFEGAEDLSGGGGSKYGTSVSREVAMDPSRDIILAYMQNGEKLTPDHGFPVRMIIPGFIGGRMVKWLKRIIVTTKESENYYHFKDNRVLPSHVDAELANSEGGGGKKVTRVEVTMDGGETWLVCDLDHQERSLTSMGSIGAGVSDVLNVGGEEAQHRRLGVDHRPRPRLRLHALPQRPPGGTDSILINAGTDCTEEFDAIHSDKARKLLEDYRIGELITTGYTSDSSASSPNNSVHGPGHLAPIKEITAPQRSDDQVLGLPVGKHIFLCAAIDDKLCMRAYTPTSHVDQAILKDPEDETEMFVVYANRTEEDILLRAELDAWAEKYPDRVKVWYVVQESIEEGWKYSTGFITEAVLKDHIPAGSKTTLALACGPPPMIQFAVNPNLEKMGYDIKDSLLVF